MQRRNFLKALGIGTVLTGTTQAKTVKTPSVIPATVTPSPVPEINAAEPFYAWQVLDSVAFCKLVQEKFNSPELMKKQRFLSRLPIVKATEEGMENAFKGRVFAADIISDDSEAIVYDTGNFELISACIPNYKVGMRVLQRVLNTMAKIKMGDGNSEHLQYLKRYMHKSAELVALGLLTRLNSVSCAMLIDGLLYDKLGVKFSGSFGMPDHLKRKAKAPWPNRRASKPVHDTFKSLGALTSGKKYDRITLAKDRFEDLVESEQAKSYFGKNRFDLGDEKGLEKALTFYSKKFRAKFEVEDTSYICTSYNDSKQRVMPENVALFSREADDGQKEVFDFALGITAESIVDMLMKTNRINAGLFYGPIGYITGNTDFNPPDVRMWGVAHGIPRRHQKDCTAVLEVGEWLY